MNQSDRKYI